MPRRDRARTKQTLVLTVKATRCVPAAGRASSPRKSAYVSQRAAFFGNQPRADALWLSIFVPHQASAKKKGNSKGASSVSSGVRLENVAKVALRLAAHSFSPFSGHVNRVVRKCSRGDPRPRRRRARPCT